MTGDFSRVTFDKTKGYNAVLKQQGRLDLDSEWNEQQAIHQYRIETATKDLIGADGTPGDDPGFEIKELGGNAKGNFLIGKGKRGSGRYYVNGILCEIFNDTCYLDQTDYPFSKDEKNQEIQKEYGHCVAYLDVWRRIVSHLEDPNIKDPAIGGPDTTVRMKTIWQVKLKKLEDPTNPRGCPLVEGSTLTTGKLAARGVPSENVLYRVEVHEGGATPVFKWARHNASVAVRVVEILSDRDLQLEDLEMDEEYGFQPDCLIELTNDLLELKGNPGELHHVEKPDIDGKKLHLKTDVKMTVRSKDDCRTYHCKVRKWNKTFVLETKWIALENGIQLKLSAGDYAPGDYWLISARAGSTIEWPLDDNGEPIEQLPLGVEHHQCLLAHLNKKADGTFEFVDGYDLRTIFQPPPFLVEDTLGLNPAQYQTEMGRPVVNLRSAINALLAAELPSSQERPLWLASCLIEKQDEALEVCTCVSGKTWIFGRTIQNQFVEICACAFNPQTKAVSPINMLTSGELLYGPPCVVADGQGTIWVFWQSAKDEEDGKRRMWFQSFSAELIPLSAARPCTESFAVSSMYGWDFDRPHALVDAEGVLWLFWNKRRGGVEIWFRRLLPGATEFETATRLQPSTDFTAGRMHQPAEDQDCIWVVCDDVSDTKKVQSICVNKKDGSVKGFLRDTDLGGKFGERSLISFGRGNALLFYTLDASSFWKGVMHEGWFHRRLKVAGDGIQHYSAIEVDGETWLFYSAGLPSLAGNMTYLYSGVCAIPGRQNLSRYPIIVTHPPEGSADCFPKPFYISPHRIGLCWVRYKAMGTLESITWTVMFKEIYLRV